MNKPMPNINDNRGVMVLVLVIIMLVATVIAGVSLMQFTTVETSIVGNQRQFKQDFYAADGGIEFVMARPATALAPIGDQINSSYTYTDTDLPDIIDGSNVIVTLSRRTNPPVDLGYSVTDFTARHYTINARRNQQALRVGSWKAFPKN